MTENTSTNFQGFPRIWWIAILLLDLLTNGLYTIYWFYSRAKQIGTIQPVKKLFWACHLFALTTLIYFAWDAYHLATVGWEWYFDLDVETSIIEDIIFSFNLISIWVVAFSMRVELNHIQPLEKKFSGVLTFLFMNLYLQYRINRQIRWEQQVA